MSTTATILSMLEDAELTVADLRSAGQTPSGFTAVRPSHLDPVFRTLDRAVAWLQEERPNGARAVSDQLDGLCADFWPFAALYEGTRNRLRLVEARMHIMGERWQAADAALGPLVFKPFVAGDDICAVREAMLLDRFVRPNLLGDMPTLAALFAERLLFLFSRFHTVDARLDFLEAFAPQLGVLLKTPDCAERVARKCGIPRAALDAFDAALDYVRVRRRWGSHDRTPRRFLYKLVRGKPFRLLFGVLAGLAGNRTTFELSARSLERKEARMPPHAILVTRGMGGVGDLTTMLPGLVALARRTERPVHFAVPRGLIQVVTGFPCIVPLAIEDDVAVDDFATWLNFGECPAARAEVAAMPKVDKGRIEIFANAAGITAADLDRSGWTAPFTLDARQLAIRDALRRDAHRRGRPLLGIAPFSREEYKRAPALIRAAERLAKDHHVVFLHSKSVPALERSGLPVADTSDLASLVAVLAACDHVVTIDTSHVHLAGALGVPTLAIFGPTDGRFMTKHYRNTRLLQPWESCAAMPCWRNEDSPCALSLGSASVCLEHLEASTIIDGFAQLEREFPAVLDGVGDPALSAA